MNALKWDKAFALEQAADDAELLQELLEIFKDSLQADIQLIELGVAQEDATQVCRAAHSIKGAAASLGILGIHEIALVIEEESRAGGLEIARSKLSLLKSMREELENL
jgi:HPt (histidine-containing phosphotransfer) domain-containing protein